MANVLTELLNNTGLAEKYLQLQTALVQEASIRASKTLKSYNEPDGEGVTQADKDRWLLNAVGPAAASAAMEHAFNRVKDKASERITFNGSLTHNVQLVMNDPSSCNDFATVLRQFLLPRSAYYTFDNVIDPRHQIDLECGYPKFIMPIMYRYMYDRDDMARRVTDFYPDECWAVDPIVWDVEDEDVESPFEKAWKELCDERQLLSYLYRMDRLCGIGHYGILLLGLDDGFDLDVPLPGIGPDGKRDPNYKGPMPKLLYMRPFDEYLSFVMEYETNVNHPRYGMPKYYNLIFLDMTIDAAGASIGTRLNRRVHWTRCIHIADNLQSSLVFGTPRMQPVFNRLLDLRKIKSGSAEMFWNGAFPGLSFEIDPKIAQEDDPDIDHEHIRDNITDYMNGLQRAITTVGVSVKSLAPQIADPEKHVKVQMQAIACYLNAPMRIFLGSEEGRLASSQDKLTWNQRLGRRTRRFLNPYLNRQVIDRFITLEILPTPKNNRYIVDQPDLNIPTDEDKANLGLKFTQAATQYVSSGLIHLVEPLDYLTMFLGFKPSLALRIKDSIKAEGLAKLKKVDPSQGSGVNGKSTNNVPAGERSGTGGSRPKKRSKSQKKVEGSSS